MSGAHVGGSQWYGAPNKDSDVDLCIFVTKEEEKILIENADSITLRPDYNNSVTYGKLNLLIMTDINRYQAWLAGRNQLRAMSPVSRSTAVKMFVDLGVSNPATMHLPS